MLIEESASLPTNLDTKTPSTMVYNDDSTNIAIAGRENLISPGNVNLFEILLFIIPLHQIYV